MAFKCMINLINKPRIPINSVNIQTECCYSRWVHRRPLKVHLPAGESSLKTEKVIELDSGLLKKPRAVHAVKAEKKSVAAPPEEHSSKIINTHMGADSLTRQRKVKPRFNLPSANPAVFDEKGDIIYSKLGDNDSELSKLLVALKSKKHRAEINQVLVEGWRLIADGLAADCKLNYVIFSRTSDLSKLKHFLPKTGVQLYKIPYKEIELWSDVETSPGILGVFEKPKPENLKRQHKPLPIQIVCDNIRTPGNLGAILRAAVGVGCEAVYLVKGCVDLWEPKVVRSAAGAHFRLPVHSSIEWHKLPTLLGDNSSVFIADNNAKTLISSKIDAEDSDIALSDLNIPVLPYYGVDFGALNSITLLIGGETEGISIDSYRYAARKNGLRLNIPLEAGVDSLNTGMATAVIAFEMRRQILEAKAKVHAAVAANG